MLLRNVRAAAATSALAVFTAAAPAQAQKPIVASELPEQSFIDADGRPTSFPRSYETWLTMSLREPNVPRSVLESAILMGIGTAYYWVDPLANSADWDYPTLGAKLSFESVRFDNNLFATNHVLHPLAGAANYGLARVNGFAPSAAFASTAAFSVIWEYLLEYREQASINDMIFTPFGGMAIGEFAFQLGAYLNSAPDGGKFPQKFAASTLGLPQRFHDSLDGRSQPRAPPLDSLGLSSAFSHRFWVAYRETLVRNDAHETGNLHGFAIEAELVAMPGFLRPGSFSHAFSDGNFVEMRSRAAWGSEGMNDVDLDFRTALLGTYAQDVSGMRGGKPVGRAAMIALSSGFVFDQRDILGLTDRYSIVHVLGPEAVLWLGSGGVLSVFDFSIHGDFAGIHPLALAAWQAEHEDAVEKSVLVRQDYAYDLGFSTRLRARLETRNAELQTFVGYGEYDSIQGVDRLQATVQSDVLARDTIVAYGAALEVVPVSPLAFRAGAEVLRRTGRMGAAQAAAEEQRLTLDAGFRF